MKEITKLEKTSLSDFTLCGAELLHTEESAGGFFRSCTSSLNVCAGYVGMFGSVKAAANHGLFVPPLQACLEVWEELENHFRDFHSRQRPLSE